MRRACKGAVPARETSSRCRSNRVAPRRAPAFYVLAPLGEWLQLSSSARLRAQFATIDRSV
eukprot:3293659-Pyramimonas_sp.AAC.1